MKKILSALVSVGLVFGGMSMSQAAEPAKKPAAAKKVDDKKAPAKKADAKKTKKPAQKKKPLNQKTPPGKAIK